MGRTSGFPFLLLPREIRDEIYSYLFALPDIDISGKKLRNPVLVEVAPHIPRSSLGLPIISGDCSSMGSGHDNRPPPPIPPYTMLAPLCRSCKQLYWEATPFCLSSCLFSIDDSATTEYFMRWLDSFEDNNVAWKSIHHLEFTDFARWEDGTDHTLIRRCLNLRTLSLTMRDRSKPDDVDEAVWTVQNDTTPEQAQDWRFSRWLIKLDFGQRLARVAIKHWRLDLMGEICTPGLERLELKFPDVRDIIAKGMMHEWLRYKLVNSWKGEGLCAEIDTEYGDWPEYLADDDEEGGDGEVS
jgi:hypothetical protein